MNLIVSSPSDKRQMVPISDHVGAWEDEPIIQCEPHDGSGFSFELTQEQSSLPDRTPNSVACCASF